MTTYVKFLQDGVVYR